MHMWMLEDCNITEIIKILFPNERTIEQMPTGFRCQCLGYSALLYSLVALISEF